MYVCVCVCGFPNFYRWKKYVPTSGSEGCHPLPSRRPCKSSVQYMELASAMEPLHRFSQANQVTPQYYPLVI